MAKQLIRVKDKHAALLEEEINVLTNRFSINGLKVEELLQNTEQTHWLQRTVIWDRNTTSVSLIHISQH